MKLESILKEQHTERCGINNKGEENIGDDSSNSGHSNDESVDGYNGFTCDDTIQEENNTTGVQL